MRIQLAFAIAISNTLGWLHWLHVNLLACKANMIDTGLPADHACQKASMYSILYALHKRCSEITPLISHTLDALYATATCKSGLVPTGNLAEPFRTSQEDGGSGTSRYHAWSQLQLWHAEQTYPL